jgi:hypothetical protein
MIADHATDVFRRAAEHWNVLRHDFFAITAARIPQSVDWRLTG